MKKVALRKATFLHTERLRTVSVQWAELVPTVNNNVDLEFLSTPQCKVLNACVQVLIPLLTPRNIRVPRLFYARILLFTAVFGHFLCIFAIFIDKFWNKVYKENILIITSHKLTNIVIADKIILMHTGKIVEMGTKEELLNTDSEFNKLYSFRINTKEQFLWN